MGITTNREQKAMNKKMIAGAVAVTLVFGLSACSSDSATTSEPYVSPQDQDINPSDENGYISALRALDNNVLNVGSRNELLDMGYNVCNALDNGETVKSIAIQVGSQQDTIEGQNAAYGVIAGAVIYLCPEYKYQGENL